MATSSLGLPPTRCRSGFRVDCPDAALWHEPEVGKLQPARWGGQIVYIAVLPYVGDNNYTLDVKFNGFEVSGYPKDGQAYGSNGEVYVPSDGDWISSAQYWPGSLPGPFYASWSDQVYQRVAVGSSYDVLSEQQNPTFVAPQVTERTTLGGTTPDGSANPKSGEWYSVVPQIWPGAAIVSGKNVVANGNPQPGTVSATTAPLWYTYAYPDASVSTSKPAYFWGAYTWAGSSQRSYSADCARAASFSAQFSGSSVTWVYTKGPGYGIANVSIDGVSKGQVWQFNAGGFLFQQKTTFSGLGAGNHTITITNAGKDPLGSTNTTISHDAFLATGINETGDPTPVTDLENNYDGETTYLWGSYSVPQAFWRQFLSRNRTRRSPSFRIQGELHHLGVHQGSGLRRGARVHRRR